MKKILGFTVVLCVISLNAFAQTSGVIRELTGDVQLKPAGAADFNAAHTGDTVAKNTIVSTGFKSTALIAVGSSVITVRPLTRLSLAEIETGSNAENLNMSLQTGRVKVDVKPPAGTKTNFTVQSPTATASVRGTSFEFDTLNLKVFEGTVMFQGQNGPAMPVSSGGVSFVGCEGSAADPLQTDAGALLPSAPAGSDSGAGTGAPPPASGEFSVKIEYTN